MTDSLLIAILVLTAINSVTLAINAFLRWVIVYDERKHRAEQSLSWKTAYRISEPSKTGDESPETST